MTAITREAVFAGFLGFGDYELTGLVTDSPLVAINVRSGKPAGASRSPRPFVTEHHYFQNADLGRGIEDLSRDFAAKTAPLAGAALPGTALEAWLLPVVEFRFDYLITPAGDWPPSEAGS